MDSFDHFGLDMWSRARFSGDWGADGWGGGDGPHHVKIVDYH